MRLIHELTDPTSQFYVHGIKRVEFKKATSGHSFLWCDRAIVPIEAYVRHAASKVGLCETKRASIYLHE